MNIKRALGIGIGVSVGMYMIAQILLNGIFKFWYSAEAMDTLVTLLILGEIAACTDLILQKLDRLEKKTTGGEVSEEEVSVQTADTK